MEMLQQVSHRFRFLASISCFGSTLGASKRIRKPAIKTAALAELGREDSDAGTIAKFVDLIADINDIKPCGQMFKSRPLESLRESNVYGIISWKRATVGHAVNVGTQTAATDHFQIGRRFGLLDVVRKPKRSGETLAVIEIDIMRGNVVVVVCTK